ncbi:MAG: hypothetical protein R3F56_24065 [Planctomycetota bacterium]
MVSRFGFAGEDEAGKPLGSVFSASWMLGEAVSPSSRNARSTSACISK